MQSIRSKVFVSQIVTALLTATLLGLAGYAVMAKIFIDTARDNLLLITAEEAMELSQRIGDHSDYFREVAREELMEFYLPQFDATAMVGHFSHFTERFDNLSFVGLDGMEQARMIKGRKAETLRDLSGDPLFREALASPRRTVAADVDAAPGGKSPFLRFGYGLDLGGEKKVGVMLGELPLAKLTAVMIGRALGQLGSTALISEEGIILWHERADLIMGSLAVGGNESLLEEVHGRRTGFRRMDIFGSDSYVGHAPVPGYPWAVIAILPYGEAMTGAVTMRNTVFFITLAVMLFGAAVGVVLTRRIINPLAELADAAADIAAGDLTRRVDERGDDEVGRLSRTFNVMVSRLEGSYRELKGQNEKLLKLDRIKEVLVTDIAHELRTPVAKQAMQLEILRGAIGEAEGRKSGVREALSVLQSNLVRQQGTIQNLLMIALLEKGGKERKTSDLNLKEVLDTVCSEYQHAFDAFPVVVSCQLDRAKVHSDGELLRLVFSNLVENSIKYRSAEEPRIDIGLKKMEGKVAVTVSDNGIGMSTDELAHAFERFYQASPTAGGIGVGLNLSQSIVESLGGKISITSPGKGQGTTVTVELPGEG